jgi:hypothetical protein
MKDILPNHNPEYWKHTKKCPMCFGRGRVAIEPYELTDDTYKQVYEQEQAIEDVERFLKNET